MRPGVLFGFILKAEAQQVFKALIAGFIGGSLAIAAISFPVFAGGGGGLLGLVASVTPTWGGPPPIGKSWAMDDREDRCVRAALSELTRWLAWKGVGR